MSEQNALGAVKVGDEPNYSDDTLGDIGEVISGAGFALGQSSGWDCAAKFLRHKSGEAFAKRNDVEANLLRRWAETLESESKRVRRDYDKFSSPRHDAAFRELDARDKKFALILDEREQEGGEPSAG